MRNQNTMSAPVLVTAALLWGAGTPSLKAADQTVCPFGCNHTSISSAVNAAATSGGGRVIVGTPGRTAPETYVGSVIMDDGVELVSEGDDSYVGYTDSLGGTGHTSAVLKRTTLTILETNLPHTGSIITFPSMVTGTSKLDGFTIQNIDPTAPDWTGLVRILDSSPEIRNCIVRNNNGPAHNGGIMMLGSDGIVDTPLIENNVIHYTNGPGVGVRGKMNPSIIGNEIFTTIDGPYNPGIGFVDGASATILNNRIFRNGQGGIGSFEFGVADSGLPIVIKGNTIHDNAPEGGIRITAQSGSSNVMVVIGGPSPSDSNDLYRNQSGVRLDHQDGEFGRIASAVIENNSFHNNVYAGGRLENVASLTVRNNSIRNSLTTCALRVGFSDSVVIDGNDMQDNGACGIRIWSDSSTPTLSITSNNIDGSGLAGIRIDNAKGLVNIHSNEISGNGTAGVVFVSEGTAEVIDNAIYLHARGGVHTGLAAPNGMGFQGNAGSLELTIRGNKIHDNGLMGKGAAVDVRHASGVIENNLIYKNYSAGVRYSDWIDGINNNTVVSNGLSGMGAGIVFDDLAGAVDGFPSGSPDPNDADGMAQIINNIVANNMKAGINAGTLYSSGSTCYQLIGFRQYNLLSGNNGQDITCPYAGPPWGRFLAPYCVRPQLAMCDQNTGEIFVDPQFVDANNDDYRLLATSPAVDAGDSALGSEGSFPPGLGTSVIDMGAYGGPNGLTW